MAEMKPLGKTKDYANVTEINKTKTNPHIALLQRKPVMNFRSV